MITYLKNIAHIFYEFLFYPEFSLYLLFSYLYDLFLEYHLGNTYFKRLLFLPIIIFAHFFGAKLYDKIMNENKIKFKVIKTNNTDKLNLIKLRYFDKGKKVNSLKI
jgi:hypothetical protein